MYNKLFTSESVGAGHPDKICDQISDLILDEALKQDKNSRVAIEVMASNRLIIIGGELTTSAYVDFIKCAWEVLEPLGYNENDFTIISNVNSQSKDINQGVDKVDGTIGAGDQGIVFGYATNETPGLMPLPITLAHDLLRRTHEKIVNGSIPWAKWDMKSQVTIDYSGKKPKIHTVLLSIQHEENYDKNEFFWFIENEIVNRCIDWWEIEKHKDFKILINPTGKFVIGGPVGDTGLTGRKIIVDTYGGMGRHGGGAFSGKDYTKVDRSGAYAARWVAKHIVASGLATKAEIQISYAIGVSKPISISVETFGTNTVPNEEIEKIVGKLFDLSVGGIIKALKLKKLNYKSTTVYGHFGKWYLPWEDISNSKLKKMVELKEKYEDGK